MNALTDMTVLLVEDNPDDAALMSRAFKLAGVNRPIAICTDGQEAIDYLKGEGRFAQRESFPLPDIVITDLKMPRVSGFDLLAWLKKHPDLMVIPTLVWSASADAADVKHAYCLGANGYLCKPVEFPKFKEMVADLLRFWAHCLKPLGAELPGCDEMASRVLKV